MASTVEEDNVRPPPHYREGGPPQVVTADTARQGPSGRRVLIVLLASLVVAGLVWAAISLFYGSM
jgi:hypothetical protein